ncbi:uncharacterized protein LOC142349569 [Convolutriloba macropyga]|uniref:uncharacterized protein LOC142349569 n=1 Tax=Convolutriloba macropyga TaxID=536237 RepID=UPI003F522461
MASSNDIGIVRLIIDDSFKLITSIKFLEVFPESDTKLRKRWTASSYLTSKINKCTDLKLDESADLFENFSLSWTWLAYDNGKRHAILDSDDIESAFLFWWRIYAKRAGEYYVKSWPIDISIQKKDRTSSPDPNLHQCD